MRHLFAGFGEELVESAGQFNAWVFDHADVPEFTWISAEGADQPSLGPIIVDYHGVSISQQALGHSLWIFQRALDFMESIRDADRAACEELVAMAGPRGRWRSV